MTPPLNRRCVEYLMECFPRRNHPTQGIATFLKMVPAATAVHRPPSPPPRVSKRHQLLSVRAAVDMQAWRTILQHHRLITIERHHLLYKMVSLSYSMTAQQIWRQQGGDIITIPSSAESDGNSTSVSCSIINKGFGNSLILMVESQLNKKEVSGKTTTYG